MHVVLCSFYRNRQTIKGVNFFGPRSEFIMSGSDCGNIFIWDKTTEAIVQWLRGDEGGAVNCLEGIKSIFNRLYRAWQIFTLFFLSIGHPHFPIIATSGIDSDVKIWYPLNPDGVCIVV